jgi:catechol 2,3-dioxygenase-like lactoylglutathione lyase family enzyme
MPAILPASRSTVFGMPFNIDRIDHVVLNTSDVDASAQWYVRVLGMTREVFGDAGRVALTFGNQKINIRPSGADNWETGVVDAPGSLDLCFITQGQPDEVAAHLRACGVVITAGPVTKIGALGPMTSHYCRDPDGNLIEIATYY